MRRANHWVLRGASAGLVDLATEMGDLFFVPVKHVHVSRQERVIGGSSELSRETYFCLRVIWFCSIA